MKRIQDILRISIKRVKVHRFQRILDQSVHEAVYQFCINPDLPDSSPPGHAEQKKSGNRKNSK